MKNTSLECFLKIILEVKTLIIFVLNEQENRKEFKEKFQPLHRLIDRCLKEKEKERIVVIVRRILIFRSMY